VAIRMGCGKDQKLLMTGTENSTGGNIP